MTTSTRRAFVQSSLAAPTIGLLPQFSNASDTAFVRPKIAAIMTVMTHRSHAHVILENFLNDYMFNGKRTDPGTDVVSFYVDQFPEKEMARGISRKYGIPIFPTISEAICLGTGKRAVDAVLSIGEHGSYPHDDKERQQYPRYRFFKEILSAVATKEGGVPIFNDKHLSYRWDWSKAMYDQAKKQNCPLMAGSSVPLAQRRPNLELNDGFKLDEAISIHGGGVESYDFHGLEVLQSMIENRQGGETGVKRLKFLSAEEVQERIASGEISRDIFDAAMKTVDPKHQHKFESMMKTAHGIQLEYLDGSRAACISIKQISGIRWAFACRQKDKKALDACEFHVGPWKNRNLFKALSHSIQTHFKNRQSPYPVERTLLTTGIVNATMDSKNSGGEWLSTPQLQIAYRPTDFSAMREMGASWKILTSDRPQPEGFYQQYDSPK